MDRLRQSLLPRVVIFTSPKAGSGAGRDQLPRLMSMLRGHGVEVDTVDTVVDLQAAAEAAPRPIVVAAGGDGTLALAAGAVDKLTPLVPMPMGTENLLARHFGHRCDAESVVNVIRFGRPVALDVGVANDKPFLIMATCGFDAEVVRGMHLTRRGHIGRLSYLSPIARAIRTYSFPGIQICVDGGDRIEAGWAMVFNLPSYATSLAIEPDAKPDDGLLDLIVFKGRSIAKGLGYLAQIKIGRHLSSTDVVRCRGRSIEIIATDPTAKRIPFQTDGDYAGRLPLKIETLPGRVALLLPTSERFLQN